MYLPTTLAYGTYTLHELEAPEGYLLSDEGVEFSVSEQNAVNGVISVTFKDEAVKGKIMVEKRGEQLSGYTTEMTDYGELYIPECVNRGLQGVTFGVYAAENIGTPDGTVYHEMGDLVCEITTGSDGVAITDELYLGKYNVVEHSVPTGFVLDDTPHEVTLTYKDQVTPLVMETVAIENTRQKAEVRITKLAEYFDYDCGAFYSDYGEDFVFGLFTKHPIGKIPANALVDVLVTDENGKVQSTADLPLGEYYLTELDVPDDGYIMLTGSTPVDLSSKNDSDEKFTESEFFENKMYKKRIAVEKYDSENSLRKLPSAVFEVLTEDGKQVIKVLPANRTSTPIKVRRHETAIPKRSTPEQIMPSVPDVAGRDRRRIDTPKQVMEPAGPPSPMAVPESAAPYDQASRFERQVTVASRNASLMQTSKAVETPTLSVAHETASIESAVLTPKGSIKTKSTAIRSVKSKPISKVKTADVGIKTGTASVKTAAAHTAEAASTPAKTKAMSITARARNAVLKNTRRSAKKAVKATGSTLKSIAAAMKAFSTMLACAGGALLLILLPVIIAGMILSGGFGVFVSNETSDGSKPMTEAIQSIDAEFKAGIDAKIAELSAGDYDEVVVEYAGGIDGDSAYLINWNDVIAVYAVKVTMDEKAPMDVVEVTPEKVEMLREVFYDMNSFTCETEVIETPVDDSGDGGISDGEGDGEAPATTKTLIITVDVQSMEYTAAADMYSFTDDQREALEAMMEPRMLALYAELIGIDVYGGADLTKIISGLPVGTMGGDVARLALTKVGAPYVSGAKGPHRFDCSGLAYWAIKELDPELGRRLYTSAGYQFKYCRDNDFLVGEAELQPGDLVFWQKPKCSCGRKYNEIHHVGIWLGDGMIVDASSSKGRVVVREIFDGSTYAIYAYARPYSY